MRRNALFMACLLALSACQTISDAADGLGSYMPVIGERCEHWQCFTEEGQAISDANKAQMEAEKAKQQDIDDTLEQADGAAKTDEKPVEPAGEATKRSEKP